ncbi:MAG: hypothetical protein CL843_09475 [Crocinitomicaceae bacterium]|nr:hypothetical protein [Crocinitomicaceae bacterium]|tara:strand:+ start:3771 stop:4244 length:474 start_codon:yes stop_codon:yes gene_type:complete
MGFNTTNNELILVELTEPFERLFIQFVPHKIEPHRTANYASIAPVGRNNALMHYTGGADTLPLSLDFYSDDEKRQDVIKSVKWLQSLAMNNGYLSPAPKVKLIMGDLFEYEVWRVTSVKASMEAFDQGNGWLPMRASVQLQLQLVTDFNLEFEDVRR